MEANKKDYIDLRVVWGRIKENRKLFYKVLPVVFVLSCAYTLCLPRYYRTSVKLVPEMGSSSGLSGTIGSLASSFGLDMADMETSDAITPLLYPNLMEDNAFVAGLYNIHLKSKFDIDMPIDTTYYAYLRYLQKAPFWSKAIYVVKQWFAKPDPASTNTGEYDPYYVSKKEDAIMGMIRKNISMDLDKKTGVISIDVEAQDPIVCRILADSLKDRLQDFIIDYRTRKARLDAEHYKQLMDKAKAEYEVARIAYAEFSDENQDVILHSVSSKQDDLENEMQLKYNTYTAMQTQYQASMAKVQERTPAFTLLKGANVPVRHAGPKRMLIVAAMCFLATFVLVVYSMRNDILR